MAASSSRRKQDDKNLEILRELITINGNKYCFDCNQRGPTYVNTTIGSFVCSKCSGMLRGLTPPHRVKSISMATFTPEEMERIKAKGNDYCRSLWLCLYDGESVNYSNELSIKDFMSDKYEKKRYYIDQPNVPTSATNGNHSVKNKGKSKSGNSSNNNSQLVAISSQASRSTNHDTSSKKIVNNLLSPSNDASHKLAPPVMNKVTSKPFLNSSTPAPAPAPVPDFPVDFSTANIYNSSQVNNNNVTSTRSNPSTFNAFGSASAVSNDRYAALADLDLALRQQNLKSVEDSSTFNSKNPFQSGNQGDVFGNKNPFFTGWDPLPASINSVNPFMPSANNGRFINSNNPFL